MTSAAQNTAKAWPAAADQTLQIRIDLAAAYRLKQAGLNVVVLEARSRVGGRAALMHSQHCDPTAAWCRHSEHAGRPQRVQCRPVSRS